MDETVLLIIAISVGAIATLLALSAHRRISTARRTLSVLDSGDQTTLVDAVAGIVQNMRAITDDVQALAAMQQQLANALARSARHVGVVRYDAFEDMGGQVSFSAAVLDDQGDGMVITAINGRTEARTYAKTVEGGESDFNLSPEESKAISEALGRGTATRARVKGR